MQSTLNIAGITLLVIASLVLVLFSILDLIKQKTPESKITALTVFKKIAEVLFMYILPGIGIAITNDKCDTHPFENNSTLSAYTLWIIFALAYTASRYFKQLLSPMLTTIVSGLMAIGLLFCLAICIHFIPMAAVIIFPGFNLLYLSPFLCFFYLLKEIIQLNKYLKKYLETQNTTASHIINTFYRSIHQNHLGFVTVLIAPLLLIIQAALFLVGQQPDSIITQFTESCGYLLSKYQDCSCGGGHYLCSIAANGNKKLVQPTRFGVRANQRILVNRQLLIANAFENWLEEHTPKMHKVIRNSYDACNIPVNKWSKHKKFANVLYIFMKPLEWLFLVWLYLFDKKPEDRIAKQYFPKKELNEYLNTHSYERSN
ncbi:MAG: hypothetical protein H0U95_09415 [Bacteroidetes bacterium]|nr:hypothetical protein [Bacteroidota bacterium]